MQLVPPARREEQIPCRFIPLDEVGTTVASLYNTATQDELEVEVRNWLRAAIARLEKQQRAGRPLDKAREEKAEKACA
jgi:outer membrane murein-binding lipoprotein Lpp